MRTLTRYLLSRFLGFLIAILGGILATLLITSLLLDFDDVLDPERGFFWTLTKLALQIPAESLRTVLPVSAFAAALACFGTSARWLEITAMKAGGISPLRAAVPIVVMALLLSGISLLMDQTLTVEAARALSRHMHGGTQDGIDLGRGSFWYHRGNNLYNIEESDPGAGHMRGVTIYERDGEGRLARSIHAREAWVEEDGQWRLEDALIRSFDLERAGAPPRTERVPRISYLLGGQSDLKLLDATASTLSLFELRQYIEARKRQGADVTRFRSLESMRLSEPFTLLLFVLLAIPLGFRVEDWKSLAAPALQGLGLVALYLFTRNLGATLASQGVAPAFATPWIVLAVFLGLGTWQLLRVPR